MGSAVTYRIPRTGGFYASTVATVGIVTNAYDDWHAVLTAHGDPRARPGVRLTSGRLDDDEVTATVSVDAGADGPVEFGDNLYGATAWARGDSGWRRVDTAEMRLMIAPLLAPGEAASIELPLAAGTPRSVRVLLGGTWADVSR